MTWAPCIETTVPSFSFFGASMPMPICRAPAWMVGKSPVRPVKEGSWAESHLPSEAGVSRSGSVVTKTTWASLVGLGQFPLGERDVAHGQRADVGAVGVAEVDERRLALGRLAEVVLLAVGVGEDEVRLGERLVEDGRGLVLRRGADVGDGR